MKILVVDDSPNWIRHHVNYLKYIFENSVEITQAFCAKEADQILSCNIDEPFDVILTDMQMESDFLPTEAGEWLIQQIKFYPQYKNSKIIIISASPYIQKIAEKYNVDYIPKRLCQDIQQYVNLLSC